MSSGRLLVVDDEPSLRLTYSIILRQNGFKVATASSIDEAGRELRTHSFDLLICDLTLEKERGGFAVVELAREINPGIRAILVTGLHTEEVAREAKSKDIAVLFKPVDVPILLRAVAELMQSG